MADSKKGIKVAAMVMGIVLAMLIAGEGMYLYMSAQNKTEVDALNKKLANLEAAKAKATQAAKAAAEKPADPYEGWLTYENTTVGYTLRYPADWTFEETTDSELGDADYVTFYSLEKKYAVAFGLRKTDSDTIISGRTGLGQGETITDGTIKVMGQTVGKAYHVNNGHAVVVFYGAGTASTFLIDDNEISAELNAPGLTWETTELRETAAETIADKVVASLAMTSN